MAITFDPKGHTYIADGKKALISVTQALEMFSISPSYDMACQDTVKASADKGTLIHGEIDKWNKTGDMGFTPELLSYIKYVCRNGYKAVGSEEIVYSDCLAGTFDVLLQDKDGDLHLRDHKTTSAVHRNSCSWQLSLYADMYEQMTGNKIKDIGVLWYNPAWNGGKLEEVMLPMKSHQSCVAFQDAVRRGDTDFQEDLPETTKKELQKLSDINDFLSSFEARRKELEDEKDKIVSSLMDAMEANSIIKYSNDRISVTYVPSIDRVGIDTARLKREKPDIAEEYKKITKVKASLRITQKEGKKNE